MNELIQDKAGRYRRIYNDPTYKEVIETVKNQQINVFLEKMSDNSSIEYARSVINALNEIESAFQSVFDEEKVYFSKQK
jgi:hypothetical protein